MITKYALFVGNFENLLSYGKFNLTKEELNEMTSYVYTLKGEEKYE